jgi:hypothetical protein
MSVVLLCRDGSLGPSSPSGGVRVRRTKLLIALISGLLGVALIVRGAWGGVWPISVQLIAGVLLVVFAALRWYVLR